MRGRVPWPHQPLLSPFLRQQCPASGLEMRVVRRLLCAATIPHTARADNGTEVAYHPLSLGSGCEEPALGSTASTELPDPKKTSAPSTACTATMDNGTPISSLPVDTLHSLSPVVGFSASSVLSPKHTSNAFLSAVLQSRTITITYNNNHVQEQSAETSLDVTSSVQSPSFGVNKSIIISINPSS